MIQRIRRTLPWLVLTVAAVAALVLFSVPASSPITADATADVCGDNPTTNRRIQPYKCEHNDGRYPSGSTDPVVSVPCAMPKPWPKSVVSCYGPAAAAAPTPAPAPAPAPPRADPPPATVPAGGNGGAAPVPTARQVPKPAPSCG